MPRSVARTRVRPVLTALAAVAALAPLAPSMVPPVPAAISAPPCYNGIFPLNPYVDNCGLRPRPPRVIGSAPDQTALLNCSVGSGAFREQCLSLFVNGGYGWYPGAVLVPGYHP